MNLNDLKKLAGINDSRGMSVTNEPINRGKVMAENNIKPGTDEWFKLWFPTNDFQMPTGFRGRVKK